MNDLIKKLAGIRWDASEEGSISYRNHISTVWVRRSSAMNTPVEKAKSMKRIHRGKTSANLSRYSVDYKHLASIPSYKLDSVKLLDSRVKIFMLKHFRIWKRSLEKQAFLTNLSTHKLPKKKQHSFSIFNRKVKRPRNKFTEELCRSNTQRFHAQYKHNEENRLSFHALQLLRAGSQLENIVFSKRRNLFVRTCFWTWKYHFKLRFLAMVLKNLVCRKFLYKIGQDKPQTEDLRGLVLSQIISQKQANNFKYVFNIYKKIKTNEEYSALYRRSFAIRGIRRLNLYFRNVLRKSFSIWNRNVLQISAEYKVLALNLRNIQRRRKQMYSVFFWGKLISN